MLSWLFPYFVYAACSTAGGFSAGAMYFGPFNEEEEANAAGLYLRQEFQCEVQWIERKWRWIEASPMKGVGYDEDR